ncbi:hypothetical protein C8F04DRAFT_1351602 [Mycena alexandri]|uniref:Uncharacterized protein n=1 Tax=Mycena alexandri TaxID=1745969 RepID=A0AAD6XA76_9AGAR|nr:hypothetical protein C8F04DRAFT_1351602 [Mycena alexandri]
MTLVKPCAQLLLGFVDLPTFVRVFRVFSSRDSGSRAGFSVVHSGSKTNLSTRNRHKCRRSSLSPPKMIMFTVVPPARNSSNMSPPPPRRSYAKWDSKFKKPCFSSIEETEVGDDRSSSGEVTETTDTCIDALCTLEEKKNVEYENNVEAIPDLDSTIAFIDTLSSPDSKKNDTWGAGEPTRLSLDVISVQDLKKIDKIDVVVQVDEEDDDLRHTRSSLRAFPRIYYSRKRPPY